MLNNRAGMEHFFPSIFNVAHFIKVMDRFFFVEPNARNCFLGLFILTFMRGSLMVHSVQNQLPLCSVSNSIKDQSDAWQKTFASVNFEISMSYDYKTPS